MRIFTLFLSVLCLSLSVSAAEYPIDRLDQRTLPLNGVYNFTRTGSGVHAYIVDSLIRYSHVEFGGRADIVYNPCEQSPFINQPSHGTGVAGLFGSSSYGPATAAYIHSVANCTLIPGVNPTVDAVNWVTANRINPAVGIISYNSRNFNAAEVTAINASIASGVTWVVSAGNDSADACPQTQLDAIVLGALQIDGPTTEVLWGSSNYGSCVTLFAACGGTTTFNTSDTATGGFCGTSGSTPIVGGIVALMLEADPTLSPAIIKQRLIDWSTKGEISGNLNGSPNRIAYSLDTTISGRVTNFLGLAVSNAVVKLTDSNGVSRYATTSTFGLYKFENVIPYQDYTLSIPSHKRYRFTPQVFNNVTVSLFNVDFVALE